MTKIHRTFLTVQAVVCSLVLVLGVFDVPAQAAEKLRIVVSEYEPYSGERLADFGPVVKLTVMAFRKAGYDTEVRVLPWSRCVLAGQNGECDVICGVWFNTGREEWMELSDGLLTNEVGLYARSADDLVFTSFADLKERHVEIGMVRGYINPPEIETLGLTTEYARDDEQNMRLLLAGRVRIAVMDRLLGRYLLRNQGHERDARWLGTVQINTLRNGIMKTSGGKWQQRRDDFNRSLEAMKREGVVDRVLREYQLTIN